MPLVLLVGLFSGGADAQIVLNEVHYEPQDKAERGEFIERYDFADQALDTEKAQIILMAEHNFNRHRG